MSEQKLPPDFKAKWVAALRSGEYEQGSALLRFGDAYCCLGVACVVAGVDPECLHGFQWIEGMSEVPECLHGKKDVPSVLSQMNDGRCDYMGNKKTFAEIADYIETNL